MSYTYENQEVYWIVRSKKGWLAYDDTYYKNFFITSEKAFAFGWTKKPNRSKIVQLYSLKPFDTLIITKVTKTNTVVEVEEEAIW